MFTSKGFVTSSKHTIEDADTNFRIGIDKLPTYQNDAFWNLPDYYKQVIYPDYLHTLLVKGVYYTYTTLQTNEDWYLM